MDSYPKNETPYNQGNGYDTSYNVPKSNSFAIMSMILGIFSLLLCCTLCFSLSLGAMSIIFAVLSKRRGEPMSSLSIFGIVLSCISMILSLIALISLVVMLYNDQEFRDDFKEYYDYYEYNFESLDYSGGAL